MAVSRTQSTKKRGQVLAVSSEHRRCACEGIEPFLEHNGRAPVCSDWGLARELWGGSFGMMARLGLTVVGCLFVWRCSYICGDAFFVGFFIRVHVLLVSCWLRLCSSEHIWVYRACHLLAGLEYMFLCVYVASQLRKLFAASVLFHACFVIIGDRSPVFQCCGVVLRERSLWSSFGGLNLG